MDSYFGMYIKADGSYGVGYDFLRPHEQRTPEEYPYSFSEFYIFRDADLSGAEPIYSDRMLQWDREKALVAFKGKDLMGRLNRQQANEVIESYYGGEYHCVAFAYGCNRSNGYPYGIFFIKKK